MKMEELLENANRSPYLLRSTTSLPDDLLCLLPSKKEATTGGSGVLNAKLSPLSSEGQALFDELNDLCNGKKPAPTTSTKRKLSVTQLDTDEKENADGNLRFTKTPGKRRQRLLNENVRKLDALCDTPSPTTQKSGYSSVNKVEPSSFKPSPSPVQQSPLQDLSAEIERKSTSRFGGSKLRAPKAAGLRRPTYKVR
jgi:hypothetical protein